MGGDCVADGNAVKTEGWEFRPWNQVGFDFWSRLVVF